MAPRAAKQIRLCPRLLLHGCRRVFPPVLAPRHTRRPRRVYLTPACAPASYCRQYNHLFCRNAIGLRVGEAAPRLAAAARAGARHSLHDRRNRNNPQAKET